MGAGGFGFKKTTFFSLFCVRLHQSNPPPPSSAAGGDAPRSDLIARYGAGGLHLPAGARIQ